MLSTQTETPTNARKNIFQLLKKVVEEQEVVIINCRDGENVALIALQNCYKASANAHNC